MTNHMQTAIEAAADELHPGLFSLSDHRYSIRFDNPVDYRAEHQADVLVDVGIALYSTLPHLRAMIAEEIRAEEITKEHAPNQDFREGVMLGLEHAARIAEGPQMSQRPDYCREHKYRIETGFTCTKCGYNRPSEEENRLEELRHAKAQALEEAARELDHLAIDFTINRGNYALEDDSPAQMIALASVTIRNLKDNQ